MKKLFTLVFLCLFALNASAQELGGFNTNFGTDGTFLFEPSEAHDYMEKILVQEDGKIITVGIARVDKKNYSIYVSRHNSDGSFDETYGEGGIAYLKVNPLIYKNVAFDADFDEDGYLYIAGHTYDFVDNTAFVVCLDENGFENEDYGDKGYVVSEYGGGIVYEAIDVDSKGRAVVAGYLNDQILVTRYNAKGKLDQTFGEDGTVIYTFGEGTNSNAFDVKVLEDGKILVAGFMVEDTGEGYYIFNSCVLRLKSSGELDTTFGDGGTLLLYAGEYAEYALSIAVQPDGKYIIAGYDELWSDTPEMPRYESYVTRINTDGTIDETFGTEGFVKFEPFEGDGCVNYCHSVVAASDGQIFGTLYSYNFATIASRAYVFNLNADGQLNEEFAGSGIIALPKFADDEQEIRTNAVALKDNKNLLVGGFITVEDADNLKLFLSCLNIDVKDGNDEGNDDETGVEEVTANFNIYPNPATSAIFVETSSNENAQVSIIDLTGRCVKEVETSKAVTMINIEDIERGVYFISVEQNGNRKVEKLVVK